MPGIVAGAADLDPAAVLTATVAGATFGLSVAWVVLLSLPVLKSVFSVSARIGHESRKGLVELTREHYGRSAGFALALGVVVVNLAMIVGDLVAVAEAAGRIMDQPGIFFLAGIAFFIWYLLLLGHFEKITLWMGGLSLVLLAYVVAALLATDSFGALLKGVFLPSISLRGDYVMAVIAVFGSLLTPDVIVWQTSSKRDAPPGVFGAARSIDHESHAGPYVACIVSISAIIAASHMKVADPSSMSLSGAADALSPLGNLGPLVFSLGILGSGLVALPLLVASLCYSIAEAFEWKSGLSQQPWVARHFYVLISACLVIATCVNFLPINSVRVLYWSQVGAGFLIVPILGLLAVLGSKRSLVRTPNSKTEDRWLKLAVAVAVLADVLFLGSLLV
jgi:Mn2+/Fe2+ NRAMP family transporter